MLRENIFFFAVILLVQCKMYIIDEIFELILYNIPSIKSTIPRRKKTFDMFMIIRNGLNSRKNRKITMYSRRKTERLKA